MALRDIQLPDLSLADVNWRAPQEWSLRLRLASFGLAGLVSFAVAWNLGGSRAELALVKQQADRMRQSEQGARLAADELRDAQSRWQTLGAQIQLRSQACLLPDELPDLLDLVASLSVEHLVALESLEVGDALTRERIDAQPLRVSLRGGYHDIGRLHEEFSNLPWPVVVEALQVASEEGDGSLLDMQVSLVVPLWSEPADA